MADTISFELIKTQYFFLDLNLQKLLDACTNQNQRNEVFRDYITARDNFHEAQNRIFAENDPLVAQLIEDLKTAQGKIEDMTNNLQNIAKTLNVITAGVRLASSLIVLGSSFA